MQYKDIICWQTFEKKMNKKDEQSIHYLIFREHEFDKNLKAFHERFTNWKNWNKVDFVKIFGVWKWAFIHILVNK